MGCVALGHLEASRYLLDLGADPTLTDIIGHTTNSDEMKARGTEAFTPKKATATPPPPAPEPNRPPLLPPPELPDNVATGPVSLVKNPKSCDTCG